jgi:hypothetical protein
VTDQALRHAEVAAQVEEAVSVEELQSFLVAEAAGVAGVFSAYRDWQVEREQVRYAYIPFEPGQPSVSGFLRAARLNPEARFPLVWRRLPGEPVQLGGGRPIAPQQASRYLVPKEPLLIEVDEVTAGSAMPGRAVMATYSDEPDWGFDHELWGHSEYAYGEQPYGKPVGESSKAPFHMLFAHENILVKLAAPKVLEGMVEDRIELFLRLSRLAFAEDHDYWGYRFAAWAAHYAQDLCQPYHSRAVPAADWGWYFEYLTSSEKEKMEAEATQLAANRHFIYEDFVAWGLQEAVLAQNTGHKPDPRQEALAGYLRGGPVRLDDVDDVDSLIELISEESADHAEEMDLALISVLPQKLALDPTYDVETAPDYSIISTVAGWSAEGSAKLIEETGEDFARTGAATRSILWLARP